MVFTCHFDVSVISSVCRGGWHTREYSGLLTQDTIFTAVKVIRGMINKKNDIVRVRGDKKERQMLHLFLL